MRSCDAEVVKPSAVTELVSKEEVRVELRLALESVLFLTGYTAHGRQRGPGVPGVMSAVGRVLGGPGWGAAGTRCGKVPEPKVSPSEIQTQAYLIPERMCFCWYHVAEDDPELCLVMAV